MTDTDDKPHLSIVPYMELSFDEICELDEDVARQGVWNLREEVKRLREGLQSMLDDLEARETNTSIMWNHIHYLLKGDEEE